MCIIFLSIGNHPEYPLIVLVNRDEYFDRPTKSTKYWDPPHDHILASKDLRANGLQFGITKTGKFVIITNFRESLYEVPDKLSRGLLALKYLEENLTPEQYLNSIIPQEGNYNAYNIIAGQLDDVWYYSNRLPLKKPVHLLPGKIYGLTNHLMDTPWPKVETGKKLLSGIEDPSDTEKLFLILNDLTPCDDKEVQVTGYPFETEKKMRSIFVPPFLKEQQRVFGTRSQHVLLFKDNQFILYDKFYQVDTKDWITNQFQLTLENNIKK